MTHAPEHEREQPRRSIQWQPRDFLVGAFLFAATASLVLWQNAHLVVLWDLSYVLDTATRIALGQIPYRDFPLAHAPLTFLIQAAIIRLTGRVFFHHVLYCAAVGGLGTVVTWRILLHMLHGRLRAAWAVSVLLAAPLCVLGLYSILPIPSYDCDCAFSVLIAIALLQRLERNSESPLASVRIGAVLLPFAAGVAAVLPLFFKQNIGLIFLAAVIAAILLLLAAHFFARAQSQRDLPAPLALLAVLAGACTALAAALLDLQFTAGLGNYIHWTITFAAQRRLPGFQAMIAVYQEPMLLWMLPSIAAGVFLLRSPRAKALWARVLAIALLAAPFLWPVLALLFYDDADERGDSLLTLWPLLLILSAVLILVRLRRGITLRALLPAILLVTINGTLLSQQLWGSTYAIWPLLVLLIADLLVLLASIEIPGKSAQLPALAAVLAAALLLAGSFYTVSEERLSYAQFPDGPLVHATFPQLAGMATPGPYIPEFEELLRYAAANIPATDGLILLPGEDPFYFVTGRVPQFPVTLFDPATDPYTSAEVAAQARARNIRWLIVKRDLQIKADPTPQREAVLQALLQEFKLNASLKGYDVYCRPSIASVFWRPAPGRCASPVATSSSAIVP